MFLWRKNAAARWVDAHEPVIAERTSSGYAVIVRPGWKLVIVEAPFRSRSAAEVLQQEFGGTIGRIRSASVWQPPTHKPIRVGSRLVVVAEERASEPNALVVPAGAAFGTGAHATTAMSLRMLEQVTRRRTPGWSMFDAGTGTAVFALAARRFGAERTVAIDFDAVAIRTARENARRNSIRGVKFKVADVLQTSIDGTFDVITANLFSELLIAALRIFRGAIAPDGHAILSGVLRNQERDVARALRRCDFDIMTVRRRGKWIAMLATPRS